MCLSVPYFPLIHALVHYSRGRRSTPLISRLRTNEHTRFSIGSTPFGSVPRYLCLATIFISYHTAPPPRSLSFIPSSSLPHHLRGLPPSLSHPPSWSSARRFVSPSCADLPLVPLFFPLLFDLRSFPFPLSVSLRARVLPPLVFVIVVSSSSSFARSLTLYALSSRKLPGFAWRSFYLPLFPPIVTHAFDILRSSTFRVRDFLWTCNNLWFLEQSSLIIY